MCAPATTSIATPIAGRDFSTGGATSSVSAAAASKPPKNAPFQLLMNLKASHDALGKHDSLDGFLPDDIAVK